MRHVHPPYIPGTRAKVHSHPMGDLLHAHLSRGRRWGVAKRTKK